MIGYTKEKKALTPEEEAVRDAEIDARLAARAAASEAVRQARIDAENALWDAIDSDPKAKALVEGGGKAWGKGGRMRVYLTQEQALAEHGITGRRGCYRDKDGDHFSNNDAWNITIKHFYYDVLSKELKN
jgi:hypothetical protein